MRQWCTNMNLSINTDIWWYMGVSKNNGTLQIIHVNRVFHCKPSVCFETSIYLYSKDPTIEVTFFDSETVWKNRSASRKAQHHHGISNLKGTYIHHHSFPGPKPVTWESFPTKIHQKVENQIKSNQSIMFNYVISSCSVSTWNIPTSFTMRLHWWTGAVDCRLRRCLGGKSRWQQKSWLVVCCRSLRLTLRIIYVLYIIIYIYIQTLDVSFIKIHV